MTPDKMHRLARIAPWPAERPCPDIDHIRPGWLEDPTRELLGELLTPETRCVVELGTWVGMSIRFILDSAPNAYGIAIDHFKGSFDHRADPYLAEYCTKLYEVFCMLCWDYRARLYPLRDCTQAGMRRLHALGIQPDLIFIDADHRYQAVRRDITRALDLFPGAVLVGDDYNQPECRVFGVHRAVNDIVKMRGISDWGSNDTAWWIRPKEARRETA